MRVLLLVYCDVTVINIGLTQSYSSCNVRFVNVFIVCAVFVTASNSYARFDTLKMFIIVVIIIIIIINAMYAEGHRTGLGY